MVYFRTGAGTRRPMTSVRMKDPFMNTSEKVAWSLAGVVGVASAARLTYRGYQADALGTSGAPTGFENALLLLFVVCLAVAVGMTFARHKGRNTRISTPHLLVAFGSACLSVVLWPAIIIPVGVLAFHLFRKEPVPSGV